MSKNTTGLALIIMVAIAGATAYPQQTAPAAISIYSDAIVGQVAVFSAGFDAAKYTLQGEPKLWAKEGDSPIPSKSTEQWGRCNNSNNAAAANCGPGKVNIFFNTQYDHVGMNAPPWGQVLSDGRWMVTAQAQPPAAGQHWRVRIELDLLPK